MLRMYLNLNIKDYRSLSLYMFESFCIVRVNKNFGPQLFNTKCIDHLSEALTISYCYLSSLIVLWLSVLVTADSFNQLYQAIKADKV